MSKLILLATLMALAGCANTPPADTPLADTEVPGLIATCNIAADSSTYEGQALRACGTLAKHRLLYLAEPHAASEYSKDQQNLKRWQACEFSQSVVDNRGGRRRSCSPNGSY